MIKKTVTYVDHNDVERTEDLYFDLSQPELMELQLTTKGGYAELLKGIANSENAAEAMKIVKEIIQISYGEKSVDGRHFRKSPEILEEFKHSKAYTTLYMQLMEDENLLVEFAKGIMPADIADGTYDPANKSHVPAHLRNHPSMQGHQAKTQPSAIQSVPDLPREEPAQDPEFQEFLAWKESQKTSSAKDQPGPSEG